MQIGAPDPASEAWDRAHHAYATAYIFERRARILRRRLKWLNFVSLVVPIVVGGMALAYGAGFPWLGFVVTIGATIGLMQIVVSTWSTVAQWVDSYEYSITSMLDNQQLARRFRDLGAAGLLRDESKIEFEVLKALDDSRQNQDYAKEIKDSEKRMGMRAALRERRRECSGCGEVPKDMTPTDCGVCGKFRV